MEVGGPLDIELPTVNSYEPAELTALVTENTGGWALQQEYGASQNVNW